MRLFTLIGSFESDEDGAVTVDWVVLTGFIVGLSIAVMASLGGATSNYADTISSTMTSRDVGTF